MKLCSNCHLAPAGWRVVRIKHGYRWAQPSPAPTLCGPCARATATALNKEHRKHTHAPLPTDR